MMRTRPSAFSALPALILLSAVSAPAQAPIPDGYALADDRVVLSASPGPDASWGYEVSFSLLNHGVTADSPMPEEWDGVHLALRYEGECRTYYASINRRDNKVVIKKRVPDGRSACGSYYDLSGYSDYGVPYGEWQKVRATVATRRDGSVVIEVYIDGRLVARGVDDGQGGPPIHEPGEVVLRADNADVEYDDLSIAALPSSAAEAGRPVVYTQPTDQPPAP